jgi:serine/threonine-protein kinase
VQTALSLDPLSILFRVHLGFLFYLRHQYEHALAQFRKVLEMNPKYYLAHAMMGPVYAMKGDATKALESYTDARAADADSKFVDSLEAMTLAMAGRRAEAKALLESVMLRAARDYISPVSIAYVCAAMGDKDAAFMHLDKAIGDRDPNVLGLKSNPAFDGLRGDERYKALLRKMQLAE